MFLKSLFAFQVDIIDFVASLIAAGMSVVNRTIAIIPMSSSLYDLYFCEFHRFSVIHDDIDDSNSDL